MDIIIVSQYLRDIEYFEDNNSRFVYLAKLLTTNKKNQIEIITSDFNHTTKKHFKKIDELQGIKITALHESGYKKNVSLKRFSSHKELSQNVKKYLKKRKKPDVIYSAIPSLDVADEVAKYCKKMGVRFIVDVQDLWPEAFKMVFNVPVISDIVFRPMQEKANRVYRSANGIVAVSQTYADRAMKVNKKCNNPTVVYLGTDKEKFDLYSEKLQDDKSGYIVGYVGSLAASYDLKSVIDALATIDVHKKVTFLVMGDGALRESFEEYAKEKKIEAIFTGKLPYHVMIQKLVSCDVAINPIRKGSAGSIINKVGDYAMAGLPVINTQESNEYRQLLQQYEAGINCECENSKEIALALERLLLDDDLRIQISRNSRKLGEERFDRKNTYYKLVDELIGNQGGISEN